MQIAAIVAILVGNDNSVPLILNALLALLIYFGWVNLSLSVDRKGNQLARSECLGVALPNQQRPHHRPDA